MECVDDLLDKYEKKCEKSSWNIRTGALGKFCNTLAEKVAYMSEQIHEEFTLKTLPYILKLAKNSENRHIENGAKEQSSWNKCRGIDEDKFSAQARFYYNKVIKTHKDNEIFYDWRLIDTYEGLARLVKDNKYELLGIADYDSEVAEENFASVYYIKKACMILEVICGTEHPLIGEMYVKIGFIYQEEGQLQESQVWFKRAFVIFQALLGVEHELTNQCYKTFMKMENLLGNTYQGLTIEDLA